jgi:hypothetical protein
MVFEDNQEGEEINQKTNSLLGPDFLVPGNVWISLPFLEGRGVSSTDV